jgi:hypothetical protein
LEEPTEGHFCGAAIVFGCIVSAAEMALTLLFDNKRNGSSEACVAEVRAAFISRSEVRKDAVTKGDIGGNYHFTFVFSNRQLCKDFYPCEHPEVSLYGLPQRASQENHPSIRPGTVPTRRIRLLPLPLQSIRPAPHKVDMACRAGRKQRGPRRSPKI